MAETSLLKSFGIPELRTKVLFTLSILAVFRLLAHIPVPQVDPLALSTFFAGNGALGLLNIFTGGGLSNMSIVAVGLGPYISASIIVQVLAMFVPSFENLSKEGLVGRQKLNMYTQLLTFPIALVQSYGIYNLISRQPGIFQSTSLFDVIATVLIITAGTYVVIFLGQLITEFGVGQGTSILIFAGIIAGLPASFGQLAITFDSQQVFNILVFAGVGLSVIAAVVYITQAYRRIEVQYSGRMKQGQSLSGGRSYIPIKINQAGVIPIIFAVSLVILPSFIAGYLQRLPNVMLSEFGVWLAINFQPTSILYNVFYFLLVFGFTYFYTSVVFSPEKIAEDIRKQGGFIPGIRPGSPTIHYIRYVLNRLTLAGGVFLGLIAVMPSLFQMLTGISALAVGGTGLLIVVSVILETVKQLEAKIVSQDYASHSW